jgi:type I restriction enzyme R subunit
MVADSTIGLHPVDLIGRRLSKATERCIKLHEHFKMALASTVEGGNATINFQFLADHDPQLVQLAALAERYFRDDPTTTIFKLRQFAELLSKSIAARHALYVGEREAFEDTLRRLSFERIIPKEAADVFHALRKAGNRAAHEAKGTYADALSALKFRPPAWHLVSPHLRREGRFQARAIYPTARAG